jgi:hypothetical protein
MADNNVYQNVALYQESMLPMLENLDPFYMLSNKKFSHFNENTYSYGSTVTFDLPSRVRITDGLVAAFDPVEQKQFPLSVSKQKNGSYVVGDDNHVLFHQQEWAQKFGRSFVSEMGTVVGNDIATVAETNTYRTYNDGVTAINSVQQVAQMLTDLRNYGAGNTRAKVIFPDVKVPSIINNGLEQFVTKRNDEFANSWELGSWMNADFYTSNLLPTHQSGTAGVAQDVLTIDSINAAGDQLTISGISTDVGAFLENDVITLDPNQLFANTTSGGQGAKFLTFIGHVASSQKVQVRVTADADATAGTAVVNIFPALNSTVGDRDENVNFDITLVTAMEAVALQSHVCGLVFTGEPLYCAMPRLPEKTPYPSSSAMSDSGISMRLSYGSIFDQGQMGWIYDMIYGYTLVPEYAMRVAFPING